ncbi:MAG: DciA family protein [Terriglobales bacterium]
MDSLRTSLAAALRQLPSAAAEPAALLAWGLVAGPQLAAHAEAEGLEGGVLRLRVPEAEWRREVEVFREELLRQLAVILGPGRVRGLGFAPPAAAPRAPERPKICK